MRRNTILIVVLILCSGVDFASAQSQNEVISQPITPRQAAELNGGPTLVSIHLKGASPNKFYEQLWKQVDLPLFSDFDISKNGRPLVTINYNNAPFWRVVRKFENQSGYSLSYNLRPTNTWPVGINGQPCWNDGFLTTISSITRKQTFRITPRPDKSTMQLNSQFKVHIHFFADPKVIIDRNDAKLFLEKVVTEKGENLIKNDTISLNPYNSGWYVFGDDIPLGGINIRGKTIATLKGKMQAPVIAGTQTWKVENIIASGDMTFGKAPTADHGSAWNPTFIGLYELKNIHEKDGKYQIDLHYQVPRPPMDRFGHEPDDLVVAGLRFIDARGKNIPFRDSSKKRIDPEPGIWDFTRHLTLAPNEDKKINGPITMTWKVPAKLAIIEVPFEFHNLIIPSV